MRRPRHPLSPLKLLFFSLQNINGWFAVTERLQGAIDGLLGSLSSSRLHALAL